MTHYIDNTPQGYVVRGGVKQNIYSSHSYSNAADLNWEFMNTDKPKPERLEKTIFVFASGVREATYLLSEYSYVFSCLDDEKIEFLVKTGFFSDYEVDYRIRVVNYAEEIYGIVCDTYDILVLDPGNAEHRKMANKLESARGTDQTSLIKNKIVEFKQSDDPVLNKIAKSMEEEIS